jgi:hypothetical protein
MMMEVEAMAKILNMRVSDEVAKRVDMLLAKTKRPKSFYLKLAYLETACQLKSRPGQMSRASALPWCFFK